MTRDRFLKQHRPKWAEFEQLLNRLRGKRVGTWTGAEISALSRMYRSVCYDLSIVQSREWGARLEAYLNDLVARGHTLLYRSPPKSFSSITRFLRVDFPAMVRRRQGYIWTATAMFFVPLVISALVAWTNPVLAERVVPRSQLKMSSLMYSTEMYETVDVRYISERSRMVGFYVKNNVGIAFQCFAFGVSFGIGSALVMIFNGIMIGMVFGYVAAHGHGGNLFSFVVTHGSFELTGIVISGAAGLMVGRGLLFPGNHTRMRSLINHGREALQLALGAGAMIAFAALLEAYFSPLPIHDVIKYFVGILMWTLVILWLVLSGRGETPSDEQSEASSK